MATIKIPLLLILFLCIAGPAFGADTVLTFDTVVIYDTTYLYDTTVAVREQLNEMKSDFYDRAMQSIEGERSNVNIMLTIIGIFIAVIAIAVGYWTYLMQRSRAEAEREGRDMRERRSAIDKVYDDVVMRERRFKQSMAEIEGRAEKIVAAAEKEAQEKSITSPEEKIKLINEADAKESIDAYENLLLAMELEGVSKDKLPISLHKNVGLNYYRLDRYEKAVEESLLYLDAFPDDEQTLFIVAYCFNILKNHDRAVHFYSLVTQLNPKHYIAYSNWAYNLAKLYDERRDASLLEEAIEKCKRAIEINDKNDSAYVNWGVALGKLYGERKDASLLEEVIEKYKKAIEINDKNHVTWANLSGVLATKWLNTFEEAGKSDETLLKDARAMALKAVELAPEDGGGYYNLACSESLLKNKYDMLKALKVAIEYDPEYRKMAREDEDKDFEKYRDDPDFIDLTKDD